MEKFEPIHSRHVPIQQHDVRLPLQACFQGFAAIGSLTNIKTKLFEYAPGNLPYDVSIVDYEAGFHGDLQARRSNIDR